MGSKVDRIEALKQSEERFIRAVEGSQAGIWDWNLITDELYLAPGFKHLLGYSGKQMDNFLFRDWLHPEDREAALHAVHHSIETGEEFNTEYRLPHRNAGYRWFHGRGTVFYNDKGEANYFTGAITDITERKAAELEVQRLATHDALTGLASLRLAEDRIETAMARARRDQGKMAVLFIDLDGFKAVNDGFGHDAGDALLKEVADRLLSLVREVDSVARIGGDEFLIVLSGIKELKDTERISNQVIEILSRPHLYAGEKLVVGASVGIALYPDHGVTRDAVVRSADKAMYEIKKDGKNNYCVAHAEG